MAGGSGDTHYYDEGKYVEYRTSAEAQNFAFNLAIERWNTRASRTEQTNRQRVIQFNQEILGIGERPVGLLDAAEMMLSLKQLREEIQEIEDAFNKGDLVGVVDGLVDLDFFGRGVVYKHGICPEAYSRCFKAVFEANMQKARGKKKGRDEFGDVADAIKPEGWEPPEERIRAILEEYVK